MSEHPYHHLRTESRGPVVIAQVSERGFAPDPGIRLEIREDLERLVASSGAGIVLDLRAVPYLARGASGMLLTLARRLGIRPFAVCLPRELRDVMRISRFDTLVCCTDDLEEAIRQAHVPRKAMASPRVGEATPHAPPPYAADEAGAGPIAPGCLALEHIGTVAVGRFVQPFLVEERDVEAVRDRLLHLVQEHGCRAILLNFRQVRIMGMAAFGVVLTLNKRLAGAGGTLKLCGLRGGPLESFHRLRLDRTLEHLDDEQAALDSF